MIYLLDLGFGNISSVTRFLDSLSARYAVTSVNDVLNISRGVILLPGNGHWTSYLKDPSLVHFLRNLPRKVGLIGICGGFQVMFEQSDEGPEVGIGIFKGRVERLESDVFPNVGFKQVSNGHDYYFLHGYGVPVTDMPCEVNTYRCMSKTYMACCQYKNIAGFQFHPEVSGRAGREIFLEYLKRIKESTSGR